MISDKNGAPELEIVLKDKAKLLGVTLREVTNQVRSGFFGFEVQRLQHGKDEEKVWVRYEKEYRKNFEQLENMQIRLGFKGEFPLKELVDFKNNS